MKPDEPLYVVIVKYPGDDLNIRKFDSLVQALDFAKFQKERMDDPEDVNIVSVQLFAILKEW